MLEHKHALDSEPEGESGEIPADSVADEEGQPDIALRVDVQSVLVELTPFQQSICQLLSRGYPVKRVAEILGKPRRTLRGHMERIREAFLRKGFEGYFFPKKSEK